MKEHGAETQPKLGSELKVLLEPTTPASVLKLYIDRVIIPQMNIARGRTEPMSKLEIVQKLFSTQQEKPGEVLELTTALFQDQPGFQRDYVEIALEVADIIYYTRQKNGPTYLQNPAPLFEVLGLTYPDALAFCCLKYSIRLEQTDSTLTKKEEYKAMQCFLENYSSYTFMQH